MKQVNSTNDPILKLIKGLKDKIPQKMKQINIAYRGYMYTFHFIPIILKRMHEDYEQFYEAKRIEAEIIEAPEAEPRALSVKEKDILQKGREKEFCLYLDIEDFFMHASILMYKASRIACLLLGIQPHRSFNKHREYFIKNRSFLKNDKYAEYIRNNTDWFKTELRDVRDDFIVHGEPHSWFISFGKNRFRVSKGTVSSKQKESEILLKLKNKYKEKLPEIKDVEDNLWQILAFLERNLEKIEEDDVKRVKHVRQIVGGVVPSVSRLTKQIFEYLNFMNDYFTEKYS
jgi:hypothetical protein